MPRTKTMGRAANGVGSIRKKVCSEEREKLTLTMKPVPQWAFDPGTGKQIQKSITGKTQKR